MRRAARVPMTVGTASTSIATNANCDTALTVPSSPSSHPAPAAASGTSTHQLGCGATSRSDARARQTSHAEIGATRKPCANVSERAQMPTIAAPVRQ